MNYNLRTLTLEGLRVSKDVTVVANYLGHIPPMRLQSLHLTLCVEDASTHLMQGWDTLDATLASSAFTNLCGVRIFLEQKTPEPPNKGNETSSPYLKTPAAEVGRLLPKIKAKGLLPLLD